MNGLLSAAMIIADIDRIVGLDAQLLHDAIITGINVLILFLLGSYFLFNPARKFLAKRQEKIKNDIDSAKADKEAAAAMKAEYEAKLKEIHKESEAMLADARQRAMKQEAQIVDEARAEAARLIARANNEIELEQKKAADDMKQQMIAIASAMAGKVVSQNIDTTIQDSLVEETLSEIGESTWQS